MPYSYFLIDVVVISLFLSFVSLPYWFGQYANCYLIILSGNLYAIFLFFYRCCYFLLFFFLSVFCHSLSLPFTSPLHRIIAISSYHYVSSSSSSSSVFLLLCYFFFLLLISPRSFFSPSFSVVQAAPTHAYCWYINLNLDHRIPQDFAIMIPG